MVSVILGAIWDIISWNDFQLPRAAWSAITTGSAD